MSRVSSHFQAAATPAPAAPAKRSCVNQIAQDLVELSVTGRLNGSAQPTQSAATNLVVSRAVSSAAAPPGSAAANNNNNNNNDPKCVFLSEVEQAILRSTVPVEIHEAEEITVLGQRGIWANKAEVVNWKGVLPINQYVINEDAQPEIITKRTEQRIEYLQELAIRYLRPPTPPPPGEILISQECNSLTPPAPPLIIRQQPARPETPEPLVIREAPPNPPPQVCQKVITISGKRLPPPPRKVVIERLAPLPCKPQSVIVERWLPYSEVKRRVIFQRSCEQDAVACKPRNVIVQWEAPHVDVKKEVKYLGVIRANPAEYVQRYGATLKLSKDLPEFVLEIKTPNGLVLAADYQYQTTHELEGDLDAFKLVDLEREGLAEYRSQLSKLGISYVGAEAASRLASNNSSLAQLNNAQSAQGSNRALTANGNGAAASSAGSKAARASVADTNAFGSSAHAGSTSTAVGSTSAQQHNGSTSVQQNNGSTSVQNNGSTSVQQNGSTASVQPHSSAASVPQNNGGITASTHSLAPIASRSINLATETEDYAAELTANDSSDEIQA